MPGFHYNFNVHSVVMPYTYDEYFTRNCTAVAVGLTCATSNGIDRWLSGCFLCRRFSACCCRCKQMEHQYRQNAMLFCIVNYVNYTKSHHVEESTQPGHPFMGRRNDYQPNGGDALRLGSKGRYGLCVGGR